MQWNALVQAMERPQVFYTYDWAKAVERAYGGSMTPMLVLVRDGRQLVGAASLATRNAGREAFFLAAATADYCDFISHPQHRREIVEAVFEELQKLPGAILRLANLPADSTTATMLRNAAARYGFLTFLRPAYRCAQITLGSARERESLRRAALGRKSFRYGLKALEKHGAVTVEHVRDWKAIQPGLERFFAAHVERFTTRGHASNLASAERQTFLLTLAESLAAEGWMRFTRLLVGGEPVAWNYGFEFAGSWFYYPPTFAAHWGRFSPRQCLLTKIVH